ncbi:thiamine-phosphate kinase [Pseudomonas abyssi]|jgi:thiamine-monophosphate kinase|uniref:Thiamine-monophosphate kinase n=1 Tax=Pseudomonas abyssi TaxID=170540 RepID=A0A2A3MD35_9PSED|nr:thiamine-phosphate kinase [Pseudomonadales bacterium]PBK02746.1 thiamine-phosphate kinase [Pseudomonas abyssi]|tara:strand:+ start:908 stop:1903 length:996 start_codon:yes stop_codon:yes gene_type:complete
MALDEFDLIARYFRTERLQRAAASGAVALGIGDDAALLQPAAGQQLVISTDTLVEGVHFPVNCPPAELGYRALAVAVSDLAAMAAEPLGFTLALTLPQAEAGWLQAFSAGLGDAARDCRINLIGGDTTRGPLNIGVTVFGQVPAAQALTRSGARPGDLLCVGGCLGDGAAGLAVVLGQALPAGLPMAEQNYLHQRFWRPLPQLALGALLRGHASAGLDVSDGLLADAAHIAKASGVCLQINGPQLPMSDALRSWPERQQLDWMLRGGDDYVLLFTLPRAARGQIQRWRQAGQRVSVIGQVQAGQGVQLDLGLGMRPVDGPVGYQHFRSQDD